MTDPTGNPSLINAVGTTLYQASTLAEKRTVEVTLNKSSSSTYTMAAFAEQSIKMDSNACTDSFNSTLGVYGGSNKSNKGDVGTNATSNAVITLDSNANVHGDAWVGTGGNPTTGITLDSNATITGTKDDLTAPVTLSSVTGPTGLTNLGSVTYDDNNNHTVSSSGQYTNLTIGGNAFMTISGDLKLYVTGTFSMDSNSELIIASNSSAEIYVDGSIYFNSNADLNNTTNNPSKLKIYGTDSLVDNGSTPGIRFNSNTNAYATVYAKNSTVNLDSNANIFGAVVAKKIELDSNTCVHYDEALDNGGSSGSSATMALWQEK